MSTLGFLFFFSLSSQKWKLWESHPRGSREAEPSKWTLFFSLPPFDICCRGQPRPTIRPYLANFQNNLFISSTFQASPSTLLKLATGLKDTLKVARLHTVLSTCVGYRAALQISSFCAHYPPTYHTYTVILRLFCFLIATCANTQP